MEKLKLNLRQMLLSAMQKFVQCSNEKRSGYKKFIPKRIALDNYKFIQLNSKKYIKFLSVDIDDIDKSKYTIGDVFMLVTNKGLPAPTVIVETDKGFHIHWYIYDSIFKNNKVAMLKYKQVIDNFTKALNGDTNFAKFIVRNPLKHNYFFSGIMYDTIDDFKEFYSIDKLEKELKREIKKDKVFRDRIDWSKVKVGERNKTLYSYIRNFMFRNFHKLELDDFMKEAYRVNDLIQEPLPTDEVRATVESVYRWVEQNYNENYVSLLRIKKNRMLAKKKQARTIEKIQVNLKELLIQGKLSVLKLLREQYTIYSLSKMLDVSRKTVKKYLSLIKEYVKKLLLDLKDSIINVKNTFIDIVKNSIDLTINYSVFDIIPKFPYIPKLQR